MHDCIFAYNIYIICARTRFLVWYPFLLWLGLFVICGIGADDIFVFVDAWRQSAVLLPRETSLASRISWTHRRAAGAVMRAYKM